MKRRKGLDETTISPEGAYGFSADMKMKKSSIDSVKLGYGPTKNNSKMSEKENLTRVAYILDRIKCLHKKCSDTSAEAFVEVKGTAINPQIKVKCNTGVYEIIKGIFPSFIKESRLYEDISRSVEDSSGLVVSYTSTIWASKKRDGNALYSINFYNTTSTLLINRTKDVDVFLNHYTEIIDMIPTKKSVKLNAQIKESCITALSELQYETFPTDNIATTTTNNTKPNFADSPANSLDTQTNSPVIVDKILHSDTLTKDLDQEQFNMQLIVRLAQLEDSIKVIPSLESTINSMKLKLQAFEKIVCSLTAENEQLKSHSSVLKSKPCDHSWPSLNKAQTSKCVDMNSIPQPNSNGDISNAQSIHVSKQPNNQRKKRNVGVKFNHSKCFVIKVDPSGECVKNLDDVRRAVSKVKEGLVIDDITKSSVNKFRQFMVQMTEESMVQDVMVNWDNNLLGNSSVRKTSSIKRGESTIGVIKDVPLDLTDDFISSELKSIVDINNAKRIIKKDKPTRCVRVDFASPEILRIAIAKRVVIDHISCKVENFNLLPRIIQCYNCYRYGHFASDCSEAKICRKCANNYHGNECHNESKCIICTGNHGANAIECPVRQTKYETAKNRYSSVSMDIDDFGSV